MELWQTNFPNCTVYTYEQASRSVSEFFLRNVLQLHDLQAFKALDARINLGLSPELLQYKRLLNRIDTSPVKRRMNNFACKKLSEHSNERESNDLLPPHYRQTLLSELEGVNALMTAEFGMPPFPEISAGEPLPLRRLSGEKARRLAKQHLRIKWSVEYQIEYWGLLVRHLIRKHAPLVSWLIPVGRTMLPRHRRK
jgi:hypothetical protein